MRFVYPYTVTLEEHGSWQVRFPDVPEAMTEGETETEADALALDALVAALAGTMEMRRPLPQPSAGARGQRRAVLPALQSAKLALYATMRERGVSNVVLARDLGVQENAVRRMLDLDHETKIGAVEHALATLGREIVTEVLPRESRKAGAEAGSRSRSNRPPAAAA